METKHTKGEWKMDDYPMQLCSLPYTWSMGIFDTEGKEKVIVKGDSSEEVEANAKLIANAPELLKGLMEIKKSLEGDVSERVIDNCIVRAEQVINKAIG